MSMQAKDIMTKDPACCAPEATLQEAAKIMAERDCGEIPVLDERGSPIGVVTDRDIALRGVAQGKAADVPVREVMSSPVVTADPETGLEECCHSMEENQIRRLPVVDQSGKCCGMLSQADIARSASEHETAQLVRDISRPTPEPSRVTCC